MTMNDYVVVQSMQFGSLYTQLERVEPYAVIPMDQNNCNYMNYLKWVALGYTAAIVEPDGTIIAPASYTPPGD